MLDVFVKMGFLCPLLGTLGTLHYLGCHAGLVKVEGNSLTGMRSERLMEGRMMER